MKSLLSATLSLLLFLGAGLLAQDQPEPEEPAEPQTQETPETQETEPDAVEPAAPPQTEEPAAANTLTIQDSDEESIPAPKSLRELVNALSGTDIQTAIQALRDNYIEQQSLDELELNRAAMEGLLLRLGFGAVLKQSELADLSENGEPEPHYFETYNQRTAYLRPGSLTPDRVEWVQETLAEIREQGIGELVLDLRDTPPGSDYELAAQLTDLFIEKGEPLLSVAHHGLEDQTLYTSREDPLYQGLLTVLTDEDTGGSGEVAAAVLRDKAGAMIIGTTTQDRAVLYEQAALGEGLVLKIATGRVIVAGGEPVFPGGVTPDVHVDIPQQLQDRIFDLSQEKGMGPFILEEERPRLNEAALVAERNPEIDLLRRMRQGLMEDEEALVRDLVLQRALDFLTTLRVYENSRYLEAPRSDPSPVDEETNAQPEEQEEQQQDS